MYEVWVEDLAITNCNSYFLRCLIKSLIYLKNRLKIILDIAYINFSNIIICLQPEECLSFKKKKIKDIEKNHKNNWKAR